MFELNTRITYGFRCISKGEESVKKICAALNLPSPPASMYYNKIMCIAGKEVCSETMREAVEEQ